MEGVGIHIFVVQCFVGQHIIIEGDHFDVEMIFILRHLLHHFPDGFVRPGIDSDFHFIIFIRRAGAQQATEVAINARLNNFFINKTLLINK